MTPEEFRDRMWKISEHGDDTEGNHADADDLLCLALDELGYREGVKIFNNLPKWYA